VSGLQDAPAFSSVSLSVSQSVSQSVRQAGRQAGSQAGRQSVSQSVSQYKFDSQLRKKIRNNGMKYFVNQLFCKAKLSVVDIHRYFSYRG